MSAPEHDRQSAETEFEQRGPTVRDRRRIDPETYEVRADGVVLSCGPEDILPMAQRYFLF